MFETMRKYAVTIALFAAITTALTSIVYWLTAPTIHTQAEIEKKILLDQVLPTSLYDNDIQKNCYIVTNSALGNQSPNKLYIARRQDLPVAFAVESTAPDGYSGAIHLLIGADFSGNILGVRVLEHHETPGLGDKIETRLSNWIFDFTGKRVLNESDPTWEVKKDGGEFDQFTGATITPRAVIHAVKRTVVYLQQNPNLLEQLPHCEDK